jgi:hypothetical protein
MLAEDSAPMMEARAWNTSHTNIRTSKHTDILREGGLTSTPRKIEKSSTPDCSADKNAIRECMLCRNILEFDSVYIPPS